MHFVAAVPMLIAACATVPGDQTAQPGGSYQEELADEAREYRVQAYLLRDMAQRRQAEAEVLRQELGSDHEDVRQKLLLAQELQKAADEADQKARTTRRQVPHNMVQ